MRPQGIILKLGKTAAVKNDLHILEKKFNFAQQSGGETPFLQAHSDHSIQRADIDLPPTEVITVHIHPRWENDTKV